jgi:hypothetical protein
MDRIVETGVADYERKTRPWLHEILPYVTITKHDLEELGEI